MKKPTATQAHETVRTHVHSHTDNHIPRQFWYELLSNPQNAHKNTKKIICLEIVKEIVKLYA